MNKNEMFENFGVAIEHLEGSKFGEVGIEDGYELYGSNIVEALNVALGNYGLKIKDMDDVEIDDMDEMFENFGVEIEHLKGSKFGIFGSKNGYVVNGANIVEALNEVLSNYGLKITYMDGVEN